MAVRVAIVGPGRVGRALATALANAGAELLGFVGRDAQRTAAAVTELGRGRVLSSGELAAAHVVVFATGDDALAAAIAAARRGARSCALWLHTSGRHDLSVFAPVRDLGVRVAAVHPLLPFREPRAAAMALRGAPAVVVRGPGSRRLLDWFCRTLGLEVLDVEIQDRALYHAACALAANGVTALLGLAIELLSTAGAVGAAPARRIATALASAASSAVAAAGASAALTGPVRRGDAATVQAHLDALRRTQAAPDALAGYRVLMQLALRLARDGGLTPERAAAIAAVLADE